MVSAAEFAQLGCESVPEKVLPREGVNYGNFKEIKSCS